MNNKVKSNSPQFLRRRKTLLALPLLVLPFITLTFWALGGGSAKGSKTTAPASGLNLQLPGAHLKDDKSQEKLSFYEEADKDSSRLQQQIRNDLSLQFQEKDTARSAESKPGRPANDLSLTDFKDPNEQKVYQKLAELNQQLNMVPAKKDPTEIISAAGKSVPGNSEDVERLDQLMQHINKDTAATDPEMNNLNGMMEKILDIQHPERVSERLEHHTTQNKENIFQVNKEPASSSVSLLDTSVTTQNDDGFFGVEEEDSSKEQNAIEAVVNENQILVDGAVIKLRLLSNISINGTIIPRDNFVFGTVSLNEERLQGKISSIRVGHSLFPVKLIIYDMDGLPGIYIPGAITRDVAKQSLDNATQMMELSSLDPSVKGQATAAGIGAIKTLVSKKTKLVKVTVKAGYKVLLQ